MGTQNVANCPGLKLFTRTGYCVTSPMDFRIWTEGDGISYRYEQVTTLQGIVILLVITHLIK